MQRRPVILVLAILGIIFISGCETCTPNWECSAWSECSQSEKQTRTCADKNNCGIITDKPTESKPCRLLGPFKIKITGIGDCASKVNPALGLLRDKAKSHYNNFVKYVGVVECTEDVNGVHHEESPPRVQLSKSHIDESTIDVAGYLIYYACYSKMYNDYLFENPGTDVPAEVYSGRNAIVQCLSADYDVLSKLGAPQYELDQYANLINIANGILKPLGPFKIKITGIGDCASKINPALGLLRDKAKSHYDNVVKYIGVIECTEAQSGVIPSANPPRIQFGKKTVDAGTIWLAGGLVHEAYHSKLYHDYLYKNFDYFYNNPGTDIPEEVDSGRNAEAWCLNAQYDALSKVGASQDTLNYISTVINTEWWEIPYEERNW